MKKEKKSTIEFVMKYAPYIGPFLIFLGMTRLMSFYNHFGVSIFSYLDLSEVILSFFDIIILFALVYIYRLLNFFLIYTKNDIIKRNKIWEEILREENLMKILYLHVKSSKVFLLFGLILILSLYIQHFLDTGIKLWVIFFGITVLAYLFFITILIGEIERKSRQTKITQKKKHFINLSFYSLIFTLSVMGIAVFQVHTIKRDKSTFGVSIIFENGDKFISDSSNYYIGKTQNYLFIHHQMQNTTDIIPMNKVKQITMKK